MSVYQTQITDFTDHALLTELSCRDLVGATLTDLVTGGPSAERITASDCDQVAEAMRAVEMFELPSNAASTSCSTRTPRPCPGMRPSSSARPSTAHQESTGR
jgi:hypothetical protein